MCCTVQRLMVNRWALCVVFSGRVNGQIYIVDLELQASIIAECCSWEMKSNEPVIKLVKQEQGCWERFLRKKVLTQCLLNRYIHTLMASAYIVLFCALAVPKAPHSGPSLS